MTKKEKVVDLKPKAEKISEEQLKSLQNLVSGINKLQFDIGTIESQKHNLLHTNAVLNDKLMLLRDEFKKTYGTDDVDIQDGTINKNEIN